ncbi:MAG: SUMF1/EgtB/PvdO family nonheme iron enzyme [Candidatus Brocadiia bacterium]
MEEKKTQSKPSRYRLVELLNEGIYGKVYKAHDTEKDQEVRLKLISSSVSRDPSFRRYIHDRWAARQKLFEHPNLVDLVEVGKTGNRYFMAVEDPGGISLAERLKDAPLETSEAIDILHQIAEGLRAVHRCDIAHGHLKPSDVFITREGGSAPVVKITVLDMGATAEDSIIPIFGEAHGAPQYMAPEVIRGRSPGPQADIFALGIIGYQLLTGKDPFKSSHPLGYLFANVESELIPPHKVNENVPHELSLVVSRCLERDPNRRYGTTQRVIDDLDRCLETIHTGQAQVIPKGTDSAFAREYELPGPSDDSQTSKRRIPGVSVAALVLAFIALIVSVALNSGSFGGDEREPTDGPQQALVDNNVTDTTAGTSKQEKSQTPEAQKQKAKEQARLEAARHEFNSADQDYRQRYSLKGNYEIAIGAFKSIAKQYQDTPYASKARDKIAQVYCEWARALSNDADHAGAQEKYEAAIKNAPEGSQYLKIARSKLPIVMAKRAQYCQKRGIYDQAHELYKTLAKEFPETDQAQLLAKHEPRQLLEYSMFLWEEGDKTASALDKMELLVEKYPDSPEAAEAQKRLPELRVEMASNAHKNGELTTALAIVRKIQKDDGQELGRQAANLEANVLFDLYQEAKQTGKDQRAHSYRNQLLEKHPESTAGQQFLREKLGLTPGAEENYIPEKTAQNYYREVEQLVQDFRYSAAFDKMQNIVRYSKADSELANKVLRQLPWCLYRAALQDYGLGNKDKFTEKIRRLRTDFEGSKWATKAEKTQDYVRNAPAGMIYIPEGNFFIGSTKDQITQFLEPFYPPRILNSENELELILTLVGYGSEIPMYSDNTEAYYIDKTEVTNAEYQKFIDATDHPAPHGWEERHFPKDQANLPVTGVSLKDARAYAKWAGKRLPTEAQWEKAARGPDQRPFPWGESFDPKACNHMKPSKEGPVAVGSYPAGASPYGVLDMIGNVWEWTSSPFKRYPGNDLEDRRASYGEKHRVVRGGAWPQHDIKPIPVRVTYRLPIKPENRGADLGFRCVKDIE